MVKRVVNLKSTRPTNLFLLFIPRKLPLLIRVRPAMSCRLLLSKGKSTGRHYTDYGENLKLSLAISSDTRTCGVVDQVPNGWLHEQGAISG